MADLSQLSKLLKQEEDQALSKQAKLELEKTHMVNRYQNKLQMLDREHAKILDRLAQDNNLKTKQDEKKFIDLQEQFQAVKSENEIVIRNMNRHNQVELKQMQRQFIKEIEENQREHKRLEAVKDSLGHLSLQQRKEIEEDAWVNIDTLVEANKSKLASQIEQGMVAKSELTKKMSELKQLKTKQEQQEREMEEKSQTYNETIMQQHVLRMDRERNIKEIAEREATLKEKFARIQDLRKKIQELEKFKFVLDYKIKELKREIGPREIRIKDLKNLVNKMRSEYKHFTRVNQNLALIVEDLRLR